MDPVCICGHDMNRHAETEASGCRIKFCGCSRFFSAAMVH